jgi:hypothetical protein
MRPGRLSQNHRRALILFKLFYYLQSILCRKENGLTTEVGCLWVLHLGEYFRDRS